MYIHIYIYHIGDSDISDIAYVQLLYICSLVIYPSGDMPP